MTAPRAPRRDALENRARVLEAAIEVFGEGGAQASTEEIAARAGVGAGTVFRHFPTKQALLAAVLTHLLEQLVTAIATHRAAAEPGVAFFATLRCVIERGQVKKAVRDALAEQGHGVELRAAGASFKAALGELLADAQAAGAVRADLGLPELMAVLVAAGRAAEHAAGDAALRARVVDLVLDGLRAAPGPARDPARDPARVRRARGSRPR